MLTHRANKYICISCQNESGSSTILDTQLIETGWWYCGYLWRSDKFCM